MARFRMKPGKNGAAAPFNVARGAAVGTIYAGLPAVVSALAASSVLSFIPGLETETIQLGSLATGVSVGGFFLAFLGMKRTGIVGAWAAAGALFFLMNALGASAMLAALAPIGLLGGLLFANIFDKFGEGAGGILSNQGNDDIDNTQKRTNDLAKDTMKWWFPIVFVGASLAGAFFPGIGILENRLDNLSPGIANIFDGVATGATVLTSYATLRLGEYGFRNAFTDVKQAAFTSFTKLVASAVMAGAGLMIGATLAAGLVYAVPAITAPIMLAGLAALSVVHWFIGPDTPKNVKNAIEHEQLENKSRPAGPAIPQL